MISSASISSSEVGVVILFLQVILGAGDTLGPVIQAPDRTSFDMGRMVGPEVQVLVCVSGLSVDNDLQAAVTLNLKKCFQKRSVLSFLTSMVNVMEGCTPERWSRSTKHRQYFHPIF